MISQIHVVLVAETDHDQAVHIPHGGKLKDFIRIFRLFDHHKLPVGFDFRGQIIQGGSDKRIFQRMALIFFMVVDKYSDDSGRVLRQKNSCQTGDILALFQQCLYTFYRFIRYFSGFPVDHIGDGGRAEPQLLCNVPYSYALLFRVSISSS